MAVNNEVGTDRASPAAGAAIALLALTKSIAVVVLQLSQLLNGWVVLHCCKLRSESTATARQAASVFMSAL
jgi:hypothetical protein